MSSPKISIVVYSAYGHILKLANSVKAGILKTHPAAQVGIYKVPETLSSDLTQRLGIQDFDLPVVNHDVMTSSDGILFGVPTRFGNPPQQIFSYLNSTGGLWASGALKNKFGGFFFSTATQHGGQETTAYTLMPYLAHHGMFFVPLGPQPELSDLSEIVGGSYWGAGTIAAGDGSRQPNEKELALAERQGTEFVDAVATYLKGKAN